MIKIEKFIAGITEKYPKEVLEGRLTVEGNVIGCIFQDSLLLDECDFKSTDFITSDGNFFYSLAKRIRAQGFTILDEVTILSSVSENIAEAFQQRGGFESIKNLTDVVNIKNAEIYLDNLYRENIILKLYDDGFNLLKPIEWNGKEITPLKLFRKMDSESVLDFYESRLSTYGTGFTSKILEEEEIEITDNFLQDLSDGVENGVDFGFAGDDINLEPIRCFPFLSSSISGLMHGTTNVVAGFSSSGKSSFWITIIMGLIDKGEKVLIISNEQKAKVFKINFLVWLSYKYFRYYSLTKKKLISGEMSDEDKTIAKKCQKYFNDNFKGKLKFIGIPDTDMSVVKKKVRQNVLQWGYSAVLFDTFKADFSSSDKNENTWISLIKDSRTLDTMAKKYDIIMMASVQLASHMMGRLWLSADCLSQSKQVIETLENCLMMRTAYREEIDPENKKYYCKPYQLKKVDGKWVEEEYQLDQTATYKFLFLEKVRNGQNSGDSGSVLVYRFDGAHCVFKEQCWARPKHSMIGQG